MVTESSAAFHERTRCLWQIGGQRITLGSQTWVMGILNCTPDSFSDGGRYLDGRDAAIRLERMLQEGADCVDVGGESTRPGADSVSAEEEWARVRPALEAARSLGCTAPISIDTTKYEVAARALDLGVSILNDVSGLRADPRLADLAASSGAGLIVMHMKGTPRTMQSDPQYDDVVAEVARSLQESMRTALDRGVASEQLMIDPGIGFGKTIDHNLDLIRRLPELERLERPILVGASRKSFLGQILAGPEPAASPVPVDERLEGSLGVHVAAAMAGAHVIRAHDVRETAKILRVIDTLVETRPFESPPRPL